MAGGDLRADRARRAVVAVERPAHRPRDLPAGIRPRPLLRGARDRLALSAGDRGVPGARPECRPAPAARYHVQFLHDFPRRFIPLTYSCQRLPVADTLAELA